MFTQVAPLAHSNRQCPSKQLLDGETLREWMQPAYVYFDGTGYGYPWEILPSRNYSLRTKAGSINGYLSRVAIAVSACHDTTTHTTPMLVMHNLECLPAR